MRKEVVMNFRYLYHHLFHHQDQQGSAPHTTEEQIPGVGWGEGMGGSGSFLTMLPLSTLNLIGNGAVLWC